jgi:hypothetical protein
MDKKTDKQTSVFTTLNNINVNGYTEKKNGLTYLSWAFAWAEAKKVCPDVTYEIKTFGENHLPYVYDESTGYMVFTSVTINGLTHDMWLPVMDSANKAMKKEVYTYDTKYKKGVRVETATMFDINKTIMRCLVKNIAMFGLGLYIFAGEDLPEAEVPIKEPTNLENPKIRKLIIKINDKYPDNAKTLSENICKKYSIKTLFELTDIQIKEVESKL